VTFIVAATSVMYSGSVWRHFLSRDRGRRIDPIKSQQTMTTTAGPTPTTLN